jgi:general L-amino acid transport system substrate-binding protein
MKRIKLLALTSALTLVIAACTSAGEDDGTTTTAANGGTDNGSTGDEGGTLAEVQSRGTLNCGVNDAVPGFGFRDPDGNFSGFDVDFCKAVAVAVLGDADAVEYVPLNAQQRFTALQSGEIDVLIRNTTWTVTRDATWGLFAPTTFYDGQAMMVRSEVGAETLEDLEGATICVQSGTTTELNLTDRMRELGVTIETLVFTEIDDTYNTYEAGSCDAVTSDRSQLVARRSVFENPDDHVILDEVMSKEPLGPVVPLGDDQWFNVVKWAVYATIAAEEEGITQANVADEAATSENPVVRRLLGAEGDLGTLLGLENDWVVGVITAVGNYGEIYDRNLGPDTPIGLERGLNNLWTEGGLLYAPPYR